MKKEQKVRDRLLKQCCRLLESYKPSLITPSTHVDYYLKTNKVKDENTSLFLREVMYGTQRYGKLLKAVVDGLYQRHSSQVNRQDRTLYIVMTYLTIFRIKDLKFMEFRKLLRSQEPHKIYVFLAFLYDEVKFSIFCE